MENFVVKETSKKQNSFEDLLPVRALHSPEPQTPSRRLVKPVFSDIELTGDFDSQIIYGKTPPTKSSSRPVDQKMKSINDSRYQVDAVSSGVKKGSFEVAVAAEDTDFGILSLPDNLLPATAIARMSVSESGYRKTGDMTTADGFDTGVSNSIPGKRDFFLTVDFNSFCSKNLPFVSIILIKRHEWKTLICSDFFHKLLLSTTLSARFRICWLYPPAEGTRLPLRKKGDFWIWHLTASDSEAPVLDIWGVWNTPSSPLLQVHSDPE